MSLFRMTVAAVFGCLLATSASARDLVIHAGRLIDGVSDATQTNVSIVVHDERITEIVPGKVLRPGAEVIELGDKTVLPGLIDCHVHLLFDFARFGSPNVAQLTRSAFDELVDGTANARATLLAGITTARDLHGYTPAIVALKRGIDGGLILGPRLWVSGSALSPTGGHGDFSSRTDPSLTKPEWTDSIVDSPDEVVRAVRDHHKLGTQVIKLVPSGGAISAGDDPYAQLTTDAEIKAAVDTAHVLHMKVAAHAHGTDAINHSLMLGVDSIEHGTFLDDRSIALFRQHGAFLVPTIQMMLSTADLARNHPERLDPSSRQKALALEAQAGPQIMKAYRAGVKIAFGSDASGSGFAHGENARELEARVRLGMTALSVIKSATSVAADLLGASEDIGSIQPGRYADIIAVADDPIQNIAALQHVDFVMKGGVVVKRGKDDR